MTSLPLHAIHRCQKLISRHAGVGLISSTFGLKGRLGAIASVVQRRNRVTYRDTESFFIKRDDWALQVSDAVLSDIARGSPQLPSSIWLANPGDNIVNLIICQRC